MAKLIGTDPNQVPTNGDLGDLAYQNKESVKVEAFESNGIDDNATSTAMTIDSSGNLLVGTTQHPSVITGTSTETGLGYATGSYLSIARSSGPILHLNRLSTDGEIATFRKDGSTVGSIATNSTSNFYIGSGQTDHVGLEFGSPNIMPMKNNALADNAVDLGLSTQRFKDLYLSGGVYLGGTGSANYLDDYETGTWTPAFSGASTNTGANNSGTYVKIGQFVHCTFKISQTALTGTATATMTGLPFSCASVDDASAFAVQDMGHTLNTVSTNNGRFRCVANSASLQGVKTLGATTYMSYDQLYDGSGTLQIHGAFSYRSA
jgi:hypothetical protein